MMYCLGVEAVAVEAVAVEAVAVEAVAVVAARVPHRLVGLEQNHWPNSHQSSALHLLMLSR